jgi:hypothetical protein
MHHCSFRLHSNNDNSSQKKKLLEKLEYGSCKQKIYNEKHLVDGIVTHKPVPKRNNQGEPLAHQTSRELFSHQRDGRVTRILPRAKCTLRRKHDREKKNIKESRDK